MNVMMNELTHTIFRQCKIMVLPQVHGLDIEVMKKHAALYKDIA